MNRNIYGLNHGEQEYFINGVRYLVSSRFESVEAEKKVTILDRIKKIIKSNIVQLRFDEVSDTIEDEYVYPTAGKENYAVEEN